MTAVHLLNNDVLPVFARHQARIDTVLSDNSRKYCGRPHRHPYELFLQLEGIEQRTTWVRWPQSNGFVQHLHRTPFDEPFRIKGREKWYESVEEMQADLDAYLVSYNNQRPHQGRGMNGKTRAVKALPRKSKTRKTKEVAKAA